MNRGVVTVCMLLGAASSTAGQAGRAAPEKVSVRVPPSSDRARSAAVQEQFERYFQPTEVTLDLATSVTELSRRQCGRVDEAWSARVAAAHGVAPGATFPAGTRVSLPACPFWTLGGSVRIDDGETAGGELLRAVGQAGPKMRARVAKLNSVAPGDLDRLSERDSLVLPFVTKRVSHAVRPEYAGDVDGVVKALSALPGASARREVNLSLIGENSVDCDLVQASAAPFDPDRLADLLERNARTRPPFRKTTVAVIDTGIDVDEQRLFLARGPDGSIGANIDPREGAFPTTGANYRWRGHGTHVAGLVLGGLQSPRLSALVRERIQVKIFNIVSRDVMVDANGAPREGFSIPLTNLQEAVAQARRDPPIPILNLSVKTDEPLESMLSVLTGGEYLAVLAAGNDGTDIAINPVYPAGFRAELPARFLTVASHDADGGLSAFSNRGAGAIDLAAPGCRVRSTLPGGTVGAMSGTSQAAPLVTFAAALLYSEGLSVRDIRNRLQATVIRPSRQDDARAVDRLDVERALSIHDDIIVIRNQPEPLVGRIVQPACVAVGAACLELRRLARLVVASGDDPRASAWLFTPRGDLVQRAAQVPAGVITFRKDGETGTQGVNWADVSDVIFAKRAAN